MSQCLPHPFCRTVIERLLFPPFICAVHYLYVTLNVRLDQTDMVRQVLRLDNGLKHCNTLTNCSDYSIVSYTDHYNPLFSPSFLQFVKVTLNFSIFSCNYRPLAFFHISISLSMLLMEVWNRTEFKTDAVDPINIYLHFYSEWIIAILWVLILLFQIICPYLLLENVLPSTSNYA